jgi:hypothetical protein
MDRDPSTEPTLGTYLEFLGALNQILLNRRSSLLSKQTSIFTTNVDMLFEVALDLLEIEANDGFAGRIRPRLDLGAFNTVRLRQGTTYEYRSEIPVVNLMKLHGSLGWRTSGESAVYLDNDLKTLRDAMEAHTRAVGDLVDHDVMVTTLEDCGRKGSFASLVALAAGKSLNADGQAFADAYALLTIVNPEKTKFALTVLNHTYYDLIRRFANEMERENSLLLALGFSFRDEHLRELVLRAARNNPTLQVVAFCYSREARDEIAALLPAEQIKNGNITLVAPHEATGKAKERKLSLDVITSDLLVPLLQTPPRQPDQILEMWFKDTTGVVK